MPNRIILTENGNETVCIENKIDGLTVNFLEKSDNNTVKIAAPCSFHNVSILVNGNNNSIEIGRNSVIRSVCIFMTVPADFRSLIIGEDFFFAGGRIDLPSNNNKGYIGNDCLFSSNIVIAAEDGHPIYDIYDKQMMNKGGSFKIGNHVWLGYSSTICKNVEISDNVIVAACSVMTKSILEKNCIVDGCPAKILKRNIGFSKLCITQFDKLKLQKNGGEKNGK